MPFSQERRFHFINQIATNTVELIILKPYLPMVVVCWKPTAWKRVPFSLRRKSIDIKESNLLLRLCIFKMRADKLSLCFLGTDSIDSSSLNVEILYVLFYSVTHKRSEDIVQIIALCCSVGVIIRKIIIFRINMHFGEIKCHTNPTSQVMNGNCKQCTNKSFKRTGHSP